MSRLDAMEPAASGEPPGPLVGRLVKGKYRLTHRLAAGSLGTTYLAEERGAGTRLVLKVFRSEFGRDHALVEKLRRQMQAVATLSRAHPNIVRVYDCDQAEDGSLFVAMEQLVGRTLREVMGEGGRLEIGRALFLARQMAAGLSAAHDAGLVHTDVRPENFMVLGTEEAIKILGFERARLRNVGAMDHLVPSSEITRTPEYTAPEQILKRDVTHQTDIYAFGIVLYEMLTGIVPFRASTPEEILAMHLKKAPTYPKALRPGIPVEVEANVMQALEKEPKWRENTANDIVADLHRGVGAAPIPEVRGPIRTHRTQGGSRRIPSRQVRRRSPWVLGALGGLLILIVAAALWIWFPRKPEVTYKEPPEQSPEQSVRPATEREAGREATEMPRPALEERPPQEPVLTEGTSQAKEKPIQKEELEQKKELLRKKEITPPKRAITNPPQPTRPPAPSARPAPGTRPDAPDPSDVIDWLLRER